MARNNELSGLDFIICPICLCYLDDPYCLPCLHSFCKSCLDKFSKSNSYIECPTCRSSASFDSIKKDFRSTDFIDFFKKQKNSLLTNFCKICEIDISATDANFCRECVIIMCTSCVARHQNQKAVCGHEVYLLKSCDSSSCIIHGKKLDLFCREPTCQKAICSKCIAVSHLRHDIESIDERIDFLKNDIIFYIKLHEKNVNKLNLIITSLTKSKEECDKSLEALEESLTVQRDKILEMVNKIFNKEKDKLSNAKSEVENTFQKNLDPLILQRETSVQFTNNDINLRVKSFDELCDLQNSVKINENLTNCDISVDKMDLGYSHLKDVSDDIMMNSIRDYLGYIETEVKLVVESPPSVGENTDSSNAYIEIVDGFSLDSEDSSENYSSKVMNSMPDTDPYFIQSYISDISRVLDILYDKKNNSLLVLGSNNEKLQLEEISSKGSRTYTVATEFKEIGCSCIAQQLCGRLLVMYFSKFWSDFIPNWKIANLVSISTDFESHEIFPISFINVRNLELICPSPCREFIFFYLKDRSIIRYDLVRNEYVTSTSRFPSNANYMNVCEDMDLMAFSFDKQAVLFSFNNQEILHQFNIGYIHGLCLLNENMLLLSSLGYLQLFDVRRKRLHRVIKRLEGSYNDIKVPSQLTKISTSSFCFYSNKLGGVLKCEWKS